MIQQLTEHVTLLQKTQVWFLALISVNSQPLLSLSKMPYFGF